MPASSEVRHIRTERHSSVDGIFRQVRKVCTQSQATFAEMSIPTLLDDKYFTDGDHMDSKGAEVFTTHLVKDVLIPIIDKSKPSLAHLQKKQ